MKFIQKSIFWPQRLVFKAEWAAIESLQAEVCKLEKQLEKPEKVEKLNPDIKAICKEIRQQIEKLIRQNNALKNGVKRMGSKNTELKKIATVDGLTGLFNRRYYDTQIEKEIAKLKRWGDPLSILMLDLDKFKVTNDTFGHDAGDDVLRIFSQIIKEICRTEDIPCRYGGEEFIIILPNTDNEGALKVAERIRATIETKIIEYGASTIPTTTSIGISTRDSSQENSNTNNQTEATNMKKEADDLLYAAKWLTRNCIVRTDKDGNYIYNKGNEHYPLNKKDNGEFEIKTPSTEEELKELGGLVKKPHLNKKLNEIAA